MEALLYPQQEKHVQEMICVLNDGYFAIDLSKAGSGKTYTTLSIFKTMGQQHLVVLTPNVVKPHWEKLASSSGIAPTYFMNYSELTSTCIKELKHDFLQRNDYFDPTILSFKKKCVSFTPTEKFTKMVGDGGGGVLLVIDNSENIKNACTQHSKACSALISVIKADKSNLSKVLFLSATLFDKKGDEMHLFQTLGLCGDAFDKRYSNIIEYCEDAYRPKLLPREFKKKRAVEHDVDLMYKLFQGPFKEMKCRTMGDDAFDNDNKVNVRNGFFRMPRDETDVLKRAIADLEFATRTFDNGGAAGITKVQREIRSRDETYTTKDVALVSIEASKISTFERLARDALLRNTGDKVVVCLNYVIHVKELEVKLKEFNPIVISSCMQAHARNMAIHAFQQQHSYHRLLISIVSALAVGESLDDKHGMFKRLVYVSPSYGAINLYNLSQRFLRNDTKSSTDFYYVYGAEAPETIIIDSLCLKDAVIRRGSLLEDVKYYESDEITLVPEIHAAPPKRSIDFDVESVSRMILCTLENRVNRNHRTRKSSPLLSLGEITSLLSPPNDTESARLTFEDIVDRFCRPGMFRVDGDVAKKSTESSLSKGIGLVMIDTTGRVIKMYAPGHFSLCVKFIKFVWTFGSNNVKQINKCTVIQKWSTLKNMCIKEAGKVLVF